MDWRFHKKKKEERKKNEPTDDNCIYANLIHLNYQHYKMKIFMHIYFQLVQFYFAFFNKSSQLFYQA